MSPDTIDTPDGDWNQYVCSTCNCKKRVAIKPSESPRSIYRTCKWCESRQRHYSHAGSGVVNVIDLKKNPSVSPAELLGWMQAARRVKTLVPTEDGEDRVWLSRDDVVCASCETLIRPDMYADDAPFFSILGNMKKRHGAAYCPNCHQSGGGQ